MNENMNNIMKDISEMQTNFKSAKNKKQICDACLPFKEKYGFTDIQTLNIARGNMSVADIYKLLQ